MRESESCWEHTSFRGSKATPRLTERALPTPLEAHTSTKDVHREYGQSRSWKAREKRKREPFGSRGGSGEGVGLAGPEERCLPQGPFSSTHMSTRRPAFGAMGLALRFTGCRSMAGD